jgi:uncharacterized protein YqkB
MKLVGANITKGVYFNHIANYVFIITYKKYKQVWFNDELCSAYLYSLESLEIKPTKNVFIDKKSIKSFKRIGAL